MFFTRSFVAGDDLPRSSFERTSTSKLVELKLGGQTHIHCGVIKKQANAQSLTLSARAKAQFDDHLTPMAS